MESNIQMWLTFMVIGTAMVLYISERIAMELVSLFTVIALILLFHFWPGSTNIQISDLLSGFGNPALFAVLALLVMGQGLFQSGALEQAINYTTARATHYPRRALLVAMLCVFAASAFLNNTPVVLMFIPVISVIVQKGHYNHGLMLMALSFIGILGGMTTLIGSSTNLLVADMAVHTASHQIGFFDQSVPGLFLALIGGLYIALVMPFLLRHKENQQQQNRLDISGQQFIVEIRLRAADKFVGAKSQAGFFPALHGMTLQMIDGRYGKMLPPFDDYELRPGDRLFIAATRKELADALADSAHGLADYVTHISGQDEAGHELLLAESVIAPGSRMIGRAVHQTGFNHDTNCTIIGVQRRQRFLRHQLSDIRLEAGDVLLVLGNKDNLEGLRPNRDILLMEWSAQEIPNFQNAHLARMIFLGTIITAALGLMPIVAAALLGAGLMVLSGVLNVRQAARAIDLRIYLLIGAAISMSQALLASGGVVFLSSYFLGLFDGVSPALILSAFFLMVAVFTNILSNNATAVLFTPIAISLAHALNVDVSAFVFAVIFAASCSFATPIAYQTNLLVMTPGNLTFRDFMKAGIPLVIVLWLAYSLFAPFYFGL